MHVHRLVLASSSPYRRGLLAKVGVKVESATPRVDEEAIQDDSPMQLAKLRSEAKGFSLDREGLSFLAIAADQVLEFEGQAFGKAPDRDHARQRLKQMQGKTHHLHSAYCLVYYGPEFASPKLLRSRIITASMTMRALEPIDIEAYLDCNEWQGCAGSYQYENIGMNLFSKVAGDQDTIIGLPLLPLLEDLRDLGVHCLRQPLGPWSCSF